MSMLAVQWVGEDVLQELAVTGHKAGFEARDFEALACNQHLMSQVFGLVRGTHETKVVGHGVDLVSLPKLPFKGALLVVDHEFEIVTIEPRLDGVYRDNKKLYLFLTEKQKDSEVDGLELHEELKELGNNAGSNLLDYFIEHPMAWPQEFKKDEEGHAIYVIFWNDIFLNPSDGNHYVRYGYWKENLPGNGRVVPCCTPVDSDFSGHHRAARYED